MRCSCSSWRREGGTKPGDKQRLFVHKPIFDQQITDNIGEILEVSDVSFYS